MAWWQIGLLKLSVLSLGIAIGARWPEVFLPYLTHLIVITVLLGIYLLFVWFKK